MALYLLSRIDHVDWDETRALVVRARSTGAARKIAAEGGKHNEGMATWLDSSRTSCVLLDSLGPPGTILVDFKAG